MNPEPTVAELTDRLDFALQAARDASALILRYYQNADLAVELKSDESPVTAADRGAEELLRELIADAFPDDAVLGEEFGEQAGTSGYRWILDPVDGTKSFVHGVPLFGTLIGLEFGDECVAGVCRLPALGEVVYAARGSGAWCRPSTSIAPKRWRRWTPSNASSRKPTPALYASTCRKTSTQCRVSPKR